MSDDPEEGQLDAIQAPAEAPSDEPEPITRKEKRSYKRKVKPPTERESEAHQAHYQTLQAQINLHCGQNGKLENELKEAREKTDAVMQRCEQLAVKCEGLEKLYESTGCMSAFGGLMVVIGGVVLGFAGAYPFEANLPKVVATVIGSSVGAIGGFVVMLSFGIGWFKRPPKPQRPSSLERPPP